MNIIFKEKAQPPHRQRASAVIISFKVIQCHLC